MATDVDSKLRRKLLALRDSERPLRSRALLAPDPWSAIDGRLRARHAKVAAELSALIDRSGWPGISVVGIEAADAATELVRGCFTQPAFARGCLPVIEQAFRFGEIHGEWFAKYYDTLMFFENKPQVYGTYLEWDSRKALSPWKIVDRSRVDSRRRAILMEKLADSVRKGRAEARREKRKPPSDLRRYRASLEAFARSAGWAWTPESPGLPKLR